MDKLDTFDRTENGCFKPELLDELAANAWPPKERIDIGLWRLRALNGVTTRANSVLANGAYPTADWLEEIEDFYRKRSIKPCFQVSPASPIDLDKKLAASGYRVSMNCCMMAAPCQSVLDTVIPNKTLEFEYDLAPSEQWMDAFLLMEGFKEERRSSYESIFSSIPYPKAFITIWKDGKQAGLGTAVVEQGWCGISNIVVDSSHRRQGVAAQIFRVLTEWAMDHGAGHLYLQVVESNEIALSLYQKLGFTIVSRYHYRINDK
ncbi:ribosomal-protein-alanine N-acetyltransferase [compost metagenome]